MDEVIASLETLKKEGKPKTRIQDGKVTNDREYSELNFIHFFKFN